MKWFIIYLSSRCHSNAASKDGWISKSQTMIISFPERSGKNSQTKHSINFQVDENVKSFYNDAWCIDVLMFMIMAKARAIVWWECGKYHDLKNCSRQTKRLWELFIVSSVDETWLKRDGTREDWDDIIHQQHWQNFALMSSALFHTSTLVRENDEKLSQLRLFKDENRRTFFISLRFSSFYL